MKMRSKFSTYKRVVVKVGSSTLTGQAGENLDPAAVDALVNNLAKLKADGAEVILVSSGAIAAGLAPLKLTPPKYSCAPT
jgi:glutamate 5-kinase